VHTTWAAASGEINICPRHSRLLGDKEREKVQLGLCNSGAGYKLAKRLFFGEIGLHAALGTVDHVLYRLVVKLVLRPTGANVNTFLVHGAHTACRIVACVWCNRG
jgi:hypothetical protein